MGSSAAHEAAECLRRLLGYKEEIACMFAAAPSQTEFLEALLKEPGIDWSRVNAFHMDEYCGLPKMSSGTFSGFLCDSIFHRLPFREVYLLDGEEVPEVECSRYEELLKEHPPDVVFMGIGENGHIAFNDPPVADFTEERLVKRVELEEACRRQQVNDGCFPSLDRVPAYALTVTVPGLMNAAYHFCIVPGSRKAQAVRNTLEGPVGEACPASILRKQKGACLYLDQESAAFLSAQGNGGSR